MTKWKVETTTIDELSFLTEEEIAERIGKCRSEMGKRLGDERWRARWEVEAAYAQRELQVRQGRRRTHQSWLVSEDEAWRAEMNREATLPEYDGNRIPRFVREALSWN